MERPTVEQLRPMLREFLDALGFEKMAKEVQAETEWPRFQQYARIIVKQTGDPSARIKIANRFRLLGLY